MMTGRETQVCLQCLELLPPESHHNPIPDTSLLSYVIAPLPKAALLNDRQIRAGSGPVTRDELRAIQDL